MIRRKCIHEIRLDEVVQLARELCYRVMAAGFCPDCIIYLETSARLIAFEMCRMFGVGVVALQIQRRGGAIKGRLSGVLRSMPCIMRDSLRRLESSLLWRRMMYSRRIVPTGPIDLSGKRVLIVDDAVDTGTSVRLAREWAVRMRALSENVRVATVTVTTDLGHSEVDFHLFDQMCRFPWSSDSRERASYTALYHRTKLPCYDDATSAHLFEDTLCGTTGRSF